MSPNLDARSSLRVTGAVAVLLGMIAAAVLSSHWARLVGLLSALFLTVGQLAILFMGFSFPEIAAALRHAAGRPGHTRELALSAYLWEAVARNSIALGVLATLAAYVIQFCSSPGSINVLIAALGDAILPTLVGVAMAAVASLLAAKIARRIEDAHRLETAPGAKPSGPESGAWLGQSLLVALVAWAALAPGADAMFRPLDWLFHWPAWLVVGGCAVGLTLFLRDIREGEYVTLAFAYSGILGGIVGLILSLRGFGTAQIDTVASGVAFMISSCFAGLLGMLAVGIPLQDRARTVDGMPQRPGLSRLAWYGLPTLTLVFLVLAAAMVLVPMEKPA